MIYAECVMDYVLLGHGISATRFSAHGNAYSRNFHIDEAVLKIQKPFFQNVIMQSKQASPTRQIWKHGFTIGISLKSYNLHMQTARS